MSGNDGRTNMKLYGYHGIATFRRIWPGHRDREYFELCIGDGIIIHFYRDPDEVAREIRNALDAAELGQ